MPGGRLDTWRKLTNDSTLMNHWQVGKELGVLNKVYTNSHKSLAFTYMKSSQNSNQVTLQRIDQTDARCPVAGSI